MPKIESLYQVKSVNIDFPFAQKNDFRPDGKLATSFVTIKEEIDRAMVLGFNTISFDTNVPINPLTGELMLRVGDNLLGNNDKSFSDEVWKGIEYAESLGLRTIIDLNIRNAYNDEGITNTSVGSNFDFKKFFAALNTFEVDLAKKAQQYGVDGFQIGSMNIGVVDAAYVDNWSNLVNSIRAVYSGTLRYESYLEDLKNPLWNLVDQIQLKITPIWSLKDTYTAQEIANLYMSPYTMGNGQISTMSVNDRLAQYNKLYPGKSISLEVSFKPGQSAGHESVNPWGYVYEFSITGDGVRNADNLKVFPDAWIDYDLNSQKIAGFLEYFGNHLKNSISGIQYWQYAPWTEAAWIRAPMNFEGQVWQSITRAGNSLSWNPAAEEMLQTYLAKGWGFHFINYGTSSQDNLFGSSYNDTFVSSRGSDVIDGGLGTDTVVYSGPLVQYTVNKSGNRYIVSEPTGSDDTNYLTNIERLKFSDKSIAIDLDGNAGITAKILGAVFGKESVSNKSYVGIGLSFLDAGWTYDNLAGLALDAAGAKTNDQIVSLLWTNVIGTKPTAADKLPLIALLENGMTAGALAHLAADSSFNTTNINLVGLAQTGIEYLPVS